MGLRTALASLPDDRATSATVREVLSFFRAHPKEGLEQARVVRATMLEAERVAPVIEALAQASVLHCDGDAHEPVCRYEPDRVTAIEVDRYLRAGGSSGVVGQSTIGRYRERFGRA